jgi:precorrin isomerase
VAGVVTERAREEADVLVAEGDVEERIITELFHALHRVQMDVEMVKTAVKKKTVKERVETARALSDSGSSCNRCILRVANTKVSA